MKLVAFPRAASAKPARRASPPVKARRDFVFPEKRPSAAAMLDALGVSDDGRGYGSHELWSAKEIALRLETELFNAWAKLQARTLGLREPGNLSEEQFEDRYW